MSDDPIISVVPFAKLAMTIAANGVLSTFGAVANHIYAFSSKGHDISLGKFLATAFLGAFVGNAVGSFVPSTFEYRDGLLLVAGFCCYPILKLIETKIPEIVSNKIDNAFNVVYLPKPEEEKKHESVGPGISK